MSEDLKQAALEYHENPTPGKISIELTTSAETQRDLALAYSPGVAEPCRAINADPLEAYRYTGKAQSFLSTIGMSARVSAAGSAGIPSWLVTVSGSLTSKLGAQWACTMRFAAP